MCFLLCMKNGRLSPVWTPTPANKLRQCCLLGWTLGLIFIPIFILSIYNGVRDPHNYYEEPENRRHDDDEVNSTSLIKLVPSAEHDDGGEEEEEEEEDEDGEDFDFDGGSAAVNVTFGLFCTIGFLLLISSLCCCPQILCGWCLHKCQRKDGVENQNNLPPSNYYQYHPNYFQYPQYVVPLYPQYIAPAQTYLPPPYPGNTLLPPPVYLPSPPGLLPSQQQARVSPPYNIPPPVYVPQPAIGNDVYPTPVAASVAPPTGKNPLPPPAPRADSSQVQRAAVYGPVGNQQVQVYSNSSGYDRSHVLTGQLGANEGYSVYY